MNKLDWLHSAELFDSWRIVPRLFLLACFIWAVTITGDLLRWYMELPAAQRGYEASGFASVVFLAVMGFLKMVYQTYADSSRDWNGHQSSITQVDQK